VELNRDASLLGVPDHVHQPRMKGRLTPMMEVHVIDEVLGLVDDLTIKVKIEEAEIALFEIFVGAHDAGQIASIRRLNPDPIRGIADNLLFAHPIVPEYLEQMFDGAEPLDLLIMTNGPPLGRG